MLNVYINYPNSRVSIHRDRGCSHIQRNRKMVQRFVKINHENQMEEVERFRKIHTFRSHRDSNDMWVEINLRNLQDEELILRQILINLSIRYRCFENPQIEQCCQ